MSNQPDQVKPYLRRARLASITSFTSEIKYWIIIFDEIAFPFWLSVFLCPVNRWKKERKRKKNQKRLKTKTKTNTTLDAEVKVCY